ncbi:hypothetical protein [Streptomyces sp. NPDC018055]|uniref:hypothetical protein n=1 Tax=Streptomyces sp. NPDC018055 TaxID=3365038 RepID=UPI0037AC6FDF
MKTWTFKSGLFCLAALAVLLPVSWTLQALDGFENQYRLGYTVAMTWVFFALIFVVFLNRASKRRAEGDELAKARPVNSGAPPYYATMVLGEDDPEMPCTCHGRPVDDGETVLIWPGTDAYFCAETHGNKTL